VSSDTIALVALDGTGLGISLIQSLSDGFGSGILEPRTGIILHNRGADFSLDPDHPNVLAGGKRPAHTLMPVVAHREDELVALAGTMGGGAQPQIDAMTLIRSLALGRSAADAVAEPRWLVAGMDLRIPDRYVMVEEDVPKLATASLQAAGFELREMPRRTPDAGHAHLIRMLEDGTFEAGTDPRADGEVAVR
jgi:gamma-glutamyltranspeptidase/glutathione hydrolase